MSVPIHPHLGPTGYAQPSSETFSPPVHLDSDSKLAGLKAVSRISQLVTKRQLSSQLDLSMGIDMSALVSALRLSLDISTIRHLANPAVPKGCLQLMKTTTDRRPGPVSIFSDEYGRMCFRLLVVSHNVCLLDRWDKLNNLLDVAGPVQHEQAAYALVDASVPTEVLYQLDVSDMGGNCDWVFGWSTTAHHPHQTLLLSQSDVSYLMTQLWDDRKYWLQAMIAYANPGLSGLLFLFSQYVASERNSQQSPTWQTIRNRVFELALRYTLIADEHQLPATCAIADANAYYRSSSENISMQVDAEDSRAIMAAYIKQLSLDRDTGLITRQDPTVMLRLVPYATDKDCQDLLPKVIQHTIKYGWSFVLKEGMLDEETPGGLDRFTQLQFTALLKLANPAELCSYSLTSSTKTQILDVIKREDLLDWTIRMIINLRPSNLDPEQRSDILRIIYCVFMVLAKGVATSELEYYFLDYVPDWFKLSRHLIITGCFQATLSESYRRHYDECIDTWVKIARVLGIIPAIEKHVGIPCRSPRCPYAYLYVASRFACTNCTRETYCNNRCQSVYIDIDLLVMRNFVCFAFSHNRAKKALKIPGAIQSHQVILSDSQVSRFAMKPKLEKIDKETQSISRVHSQTPDDDQNLRLLLACLGKVHDKRYKLLREPDDIQKMIEYTTIVLTLTPDDDPGLLFLHEGTLDLAAINRRSFKKKGLAFLSACQTATGDETLPDEAVHLASGMLMAGYSSVIATMWSVVDQDAPFVADKVYGELMKEGKLGNGEAGKVLHDAVAGLRERVGEKRFARWVPYIHIGS